MKKKNLNYKRIALVVAIILAIIIIVVISINSKNNKKLEFDKFEEISIYGYLENSVLDVYELYQISGKADYDELQIFQAKLKQELDSYFANSTENSVATNTIVSAIDAKYVPEFVDFHGIIVSGYEYNPEKNTFVKSKNAYSNLSEIENEINNIDFSNQKAIVKQIEKTDDDKYKVFFDIVDDNSIDSIAKDSGEAILSISDNTLVIDSCNIND